MELYDESIMDTTECESDSFLKINNCGWQRNEVESVTVRKNGRKDYHIVLVCKGKVKVVYHDSSFILTEGNMFFYEPGTPQYYAFSKDSSTYWVHFSGTAVPNVLSTICLDYGVYQQKFSGRVTEQFRLLIRKFGLPRYRNDLYGMLLTLLAFLSDEIAERAVLEDDEIIWKIASYINDCYNQKINLKELAGLSGYSSSRFSHLFFKVTGTSPIAYQRNIQLQHASELLIDSFDSIKSIALICGFEDSLYFSKVFKKKFGLSPSEYRKRESLRI